MEWFSEINENESRRTTRARMTRVIKKKSFHFYRQMNSFS